MGGEGREGMWTRLSGRKGVPTHTVKINFSLQAHCNSKELQSVHVHLYIHVHVQYIPCTKAAQLGGSAVGSARQ